ncbi:MAG: cupin domain-containing protein [Desulfuromonadales bacterium]|nr:cupin domain-containing protein [Desulfuromonadales bacterium]
MQGKIITTAEQVEYPHPKHDRFFLRDVAVAADNPNLSVHRGRIEPGGEILPHTHDGQTETFYILSGQALCTMGSSKTSVAGGQCCIAPSGVVHGLKNDGEEPVELLALFTPPLK